MPPTYYRGCWHVVSRGFLLEYRHLSSPKTEVYNPKAFVPHAASLGQASAHCRKFPTAASRRSLGRVSVPVWPANLSVRLPIVALVGRYPANQLMGRGLILERVSPLLAGGCPPASSSGISSPFELLSRPPGQITHALLTRPPLGLASIGALRRNAPTEANPRSTCMYQARRQRSS